jgi:sec-independent protein translocase protein TatC
MRMTLIEHLGELRVRIIKVAIAFFLASIVAFIFVDWIFEFMLAPAPQLKGKLFVTGVTEPLITDIKLALFTALLVTIPIILYQVWAFVAPAVGDMGRAFTYILIAMASSLFLAGVVFGYYVVLPIGLKFLFAYGGERYSEIISGEKYLPFVTRFLLAFGIVFEFPAATYVGAKLELVDAPLLKKYRKHAIVINTVLAAALTPGQDPFSMILMAVPMIVMYEVSIIIARYVNPTTEVTAHEPARNSEEDDEDEGEDSEPEEDDEPEVSEFEDTDDHPENGHEERDL